ncbi:hypothetical protein KAR52_02405 [Candidatus Pacearchaeota archaeon]|nr:hypothetical protein [Candidatus Pacearchaeota archaeon]
MTKIVEIGFFEEKVVREPSCLLDYITRLHVEKTEGLFTKFEEEVYQQATLFPFDDDFQDRGKLPKNALNYLKQFDEIRPIYTKSAVFKEFENQNSFFPKRSISYQKISEYGYNDILEQLIIKK